MIRELTGDIFLSKSQVSVYGVALHDDFEAGDRKFDAFEQKIHSAAMLRAARQALSQ